MLLNDTTTKLVSLLLDQTVVVSIKDQIAIVMVTKCGSPLKYGPCSQIFLETIAMYKPPKVLGDYFVLECFYPHCSYCLHIHKTNWGEESLQFENNVSIHWCMYEFSDWLVQIHPFRTFDGNLKQKEILSLIWQRDWFKGFSPFSQDIETVMLIDDGGRNLDEVTDMAFFQGTKNAFFKMRVA